MSPNPYPLFSVSQLDKSEQIKIKTGMLIRLYIKDPSPFIAHAVTTHISTLLAHPKYIANIEQRCQLRKLQIHWRCLAWVNSPLQNKR